MNDLERDLHELFDQRSRDVDPAVLAPDAIIRRGHRRQARTAVGGVLAGVVAIAVALAAVGSIQRSDGVTPAGTNDLPARATHIGGVPVTAPAGWTLIDDTPLLNVVSTSTQSCSFSASGTAVAANGSPVAGSGPAPEPSSDCTSAPAQDMPAGVPFLQLANFELPLMESVCDWGEGSVASLPADGVAIYVAAFPSGMSSQALFDACPGSEQYSAMSTTHENAYTFGLTTSDDSFQLTMAAIAVAGPSASDADLAVVRSFFDQPIFGQTNPFVAPDAYRVGPAYVLAAGGTAQEGWRLEGGIKSFAADGKPMPASIFVTTASGAETAKADATLLNSEAVDVVGDQVVQHGNLAGGYTGVDVTGPDGVVTHADVYQWPQDLLTIADSQAFDNAGGIWLATPPQEGDVSWLEATGTDPSPSSEPAPHDGPAETALDYRQLDSGAVVATGNDFGTDWTLTDTRGRLRLSFGADEEVISLAPGSGTGQDYAGGTLWIQREPLSVHRVDVSTDVAGTDVLAVGKWMPSDERAMGNDRVWVVALPGSGQGYSQVTGELAQAWTWPTTSPPGAGDVIASSGDAQISYAMRWTDQQCPTIEITESLNGDVGTSDCLLPWDGSTPVVGGLYAEHEAIVAITGPADMLCDVGNSGGTIAQVGPWAQTGLCMLTVPVGTTVTVQLTDVTGKPILGTLGHIGISAKPGRLSIVN